MFKKNLSVMWAFTGEGVMLHNVENDSYIELRGIEERIWRYLDGSFSIYEINELVSNDSGQINTTDTENIVNNVVDKLLQDGFIKPVYANIKK